MINIYFCLNCKDEEPNNLDLKQVGSRLFVLCFACKKNSKRTIKEDISYEEDRIFSVEDLTKKENE